MYLPGFDPSPCFAEMISHVFPKFGISTVLNPQNPWVNNRFPACNSDLLQKKHTKLEPHPNIIKYQIGDISHLLNCISHAISSNNIPSWDHIKLSLIYVPWNMIPNLVVNHFMVAFFASGDIVERFPRFAPIGPVIATKACSTRRLLKMGVESGKWWKWGFHPKKNGRFIMKSYNVRPPVDSVHLVYNSNSYGLWYL